MVWAKKAKALLNRSYFSYSVAELHTSMHLHFIRRQVEREASPDIFAEAHVADETHEPVEDDHRAHGNVEDTGAAQEVLRFLHLVL